MFCTNCGSQLDDRAVICPHCGVPTNNYYRPVQPAQQPAQPAEGFNQQMPAPAQQPAQSKPVNAFAIVGLVLGISGIWLSVLFGIVSIIGLIFSIVGLNKAAKLNSGRGLAIGGLVTSIIGIAIWAIYWAAVILSRATVYF